MATVTPGSEHLHPQLVEAGVAMHRDRIDIAERILKSHLKQDPFDVRAIRMLAEVAARAGRLRDSETLLRRALEIAPGFTAARANLAVVVGRLGRPAESMELLEDLLRAEPDSIGHLNLKAATLGRLGQFEEAIDIYREVIERAPRQPRVWVSYGHMLKTVGRLDEGVAAYRRALELKPALGEAWWSLANLKTVRFTDGDIAAMKAALEQPGVGDDDRFQLDFALGKALHDRGRFDEAFDHYSSGNSLRRRYHPAKVERVTRTVDRSIETFTQKMLTVPGGCDATDPIFIVGMPRAGSTLIEQILASHSQVEGTSELPDMPMVIRESGKYPESAAAMDPAQRKAAGEAYLEGASIQRQTQRPFFIDKLPNNWMSVPFIHLVLPNAKIIDARRHPLGCCLSNFRQHFARGQDFTYDLGDLGLYYSDYVRLMAHVDRALPGRVHRVIYEQMVEDTESQVRALLDHIGLEFEPGCLAFYETERAVRTPSSEQVRQPIYREATQEWQVYESHLSELKQALGDVLDCYPQVPDAWKQQWGKDIPAA